MPSTFMGLNIGKTGLHAYQSALNVTAHNIANTETPGYSRQIQGQRAGTPIRINQLYGMVGTGVSVTGIEQIRNEYYDIKYRQNNTLHGVYATKKQYMSKIENYFNEVNLEGFTTSFNSFYNSLYEVAKDPSSLTYRVQALNFAQSFTEYFNALSTNMKSIQEECNFEVKNTVDHINSLAMQISTISKQINTLESNGGTANDLRDQRALLVDDLSNVVNISINEQAIVDKSTVSYYSIYIDGHLLVDTGNYNTLEVVPRKEKINQNDIDGMYDIQWNDGQKFDMGSPYVGGTLGALYDLRDGNNQENLYGSVSSISKATDGSAGSIVRVENASVNTIEKLNIPIKGVVTIANKEYNYQGFEVYYDEDTNTCSYEFNIEEDLSESPELISTNLAIGESVAYKGIPYYMSKLNEFVRTFSKAYNDIHKDGKDLAGEDGLNFFNGKDPYGNIYGLDKVEDYHHLTADNFTVNDIIYKNPNKIVTASNIDEGLENSDIIDRLIALKSYRSMFKQGNPASFLQTLVAEIGIDTKKADNFSTSQRDILMMIDNQRMSVSGVDINEEAMNLIRYQNAYNLSAKVVSIMDEIYDRLINGMGV